MQHVPVCLFEDRRDCAIGVRLLALSAQIHEPTWMFHAFLRNFDQSELDWLSSQPNVIVRTDIPTDQKGWNVKPCLLRKLLTETTSVVLWCDSDIILASAVSPILESINIETFIATEEYCWGRTKGSNIRTTGWGFEELRPISVTVNSCFMRMNASHLNLLQSWEDCLARTDYREAQTASWDKRPTYFISDQDALTALLASSDYSHVPLHLLTNGRDIAQCFEHDGYTVGSRLSNALKRRVPPLVHAQGGKPWKTGSRADYQQLSPYNSIAAPYLKLERLPLDWTTADDWAGKIQERIFFGEPNLCGMLPALKRTTMRVWSHRFDIFKFLFYSSKNLSEK